MEHAQSHSSYVQVFKNSGFSLKISLHCEQYSGTFLVAHSPYKDFNMTIQGGQQLPCFMNTGQLQDIIVKFKTPEIKKKKDPKSFQREQSSNM